ncbi:hypothetical protein [Treponema primitia]|uniref:hypothetical protein n=1 Tax=Treponema primitia TaxID=88058 RepID=UPI0002555051|nr:hypothetical protein [Treponema primitia]
MKKYKSPALRHIHQEAVGLYKHGIINAAEMREFDKDCLVSGASTFTTSHIPRIAAAITASPGRHTRPVK